VMRERDPSPVFPEGEAKASLSNPSAGKPEILRLWTDGQVNP
jgi:hypothetical protein